MKDQVAHDIELNLWRLSAQTSQMRLWFQSVRLHATEQVISMAPPNWPNIDVDVDPCHLFAIGSPQGGLRDSRLLLRWLMDNGANINAVDAYGWTPTNYAAWYGQAPAMDLLLEAGAPVHNANNPQPLDHALSGLAHSGNGGNETCARLLLMSGADPNRGFATDPHYGGITWLTWALSQERWDWAECLWAKGQRVGEKDMHLVLMRCGAEAWGWLQAHGVDMIANVSSSDPSHDMLRTIKAHMEREALYASLDPIIPCSGTGETDGDGRRRM